MPTPFTSLVKSPNDLIVSQFNVEVYDATATTWRLMGYVNGDISLTPERELVKVKDGIPRELVAEILVDEMYTLNFALRSFNKQTIELLCNSLFQASDNAGIGAVDNTTPLQGTSTYDINWIGYRPFADIFARTAWNVRFKGLTKANKYFIAKYHRAYFTLPEFAFPNNESNADVNQIAVTMEAFPDMTKPDQKQIGFIAIEQ